MQLAEFVDQENAASPISAGGEGPESVVTTPEVALEPNPKLVIRHLLTISAQAGAVANVLYPIEPVAIGTHFVEIDGATTSLPSMAKAFQVAPSLSAGAFLVRIELKERIRARIERAVSDFTQIVTRADVLRRIDNFALLTCDWAGPDSVTPDETTRGAARSLIKQLPAAVPAPHVTPSGDGCIGFEWETASTYLAAELQNGGVLVWIEKRSGALVDGDEVTWSGKIPDNFLAALIRSFA